MPWNDQSPPATEIVFQCRKTTNTRQKVLVEIDKIDGGEYRATCGNLFCSHEIARSRNLETLLHAIKAVMA